MSPRSSSSAVGPEKRTSPFSMKYARSAMVSATFTDCSTRMIVQPCVVDARARCSSSCSTIVGREAERQLVDDQQLGLGDERHAQRELLLLAAGQVAGHAGPSAPGGAGTRRAPRRCAPATSASSSSAYSHVPALKCSATVSVGKTALPPGTWTMPSLRGLDGVGVGDVAPVEEDGAADRVDQPADGLEQRRLAGAVGAEQGDDLALRDLDVDAEEDLHRVVGDVDALAHQQRPFAAPASSPRGCARRSRACWPPGRRRGARSAGPTRR